MRQPLRASRRRQTICVVQVIGLTLTVAPFVVQPSSVYIAAASLGALCWSFTVDTFWLWTRSRPSAIVVPQPTLDVAGGR
jgi:hypothetical protein